MRNTRKVSNSVVLAVISALTLLFGALLAGPATAGVTSADTPSAAAGFMLRSELNNLCIDIKDFNIHRGAQIQTWDCWGGAGQRWNWDGKMLRSDLNGLCLDIKDFNIHRGALLQTWDCWGGAGQRWNWDGRMLRSELNGLCIDIKDFNIHRGALIQMWDCWNGAGQRWNGV